MVLSAINCPMLELRTEWRCERAIDSIKKLSYHWANSREILHANAEHEIYFIFKISFFNLLIFLYRLQFIFRLVPSPLSLLCYNLLGWKDVLWLLLIPPVRGEKKKNYFKIGSELKSQSNEYLTSTTHCSRHITLKPFIMLLYWLSDDTQILFGAWLNSMPKTAFDFSFVRKNSFRWKFKEPLALLSR